MPSGLASWFAVSETYRKQSSAPKFSLSHNDLSKLFPRHFALLKPPKVGCYTHRQSASIPVVSKLPKLPLPLSDRCLPPKRPSSSASALNGFSNLLPMELWLDLPKLDTPSPPYGELPKLAYLPWLLLDFADSGLSKKSADRGWVSTLAPKCKASSSWSEKRIFRPWTESSSGSSLTPEGLPSCLSSSSSCGESCAELMRW